MQNVVQYFGIFTYPFSHEELGERIDTTRIQYLYDIIELLLATY